MRVNKTTAIKKLFLNFKIFVNKIQLTPLAMIRKTLYLTCILSMLWYSSKGQVEKMEFGHHTSHQANIVKKGSPSLPLNLKSENALFFDNFEDQDEMLNPERWSVLRSTDTTGVDLTEATAPMWFLCTPENFNGNGSNYIKAGERSAAVAYHAPDATWLIIKDTLTLTDNVHIYFWLYFLHDTVNNINTQLYAMVKETNTDQWESIHKWETDDDKNLFENMVSLPLPEKFAGKDVNIAFVYVNQDNQGLQVAIDNIYIGNLTNPNLTATPYSYKYSKVPIELLNTFDYKPKAFINNLGSKYEGEGATAEVSITDLDNFSSTIDIGQEIGTGESILVQFTESPVFENIGSYNINYSISQEYGKNEAPDGFIFEATENILATDYLTPNQYEGGFTAGKDIPFGNKYTINKDVVMGGIEIQWPQFTPDSTQETYFTGLIYEINKLTGEPILLIEEEFLLEDSHSDNSVTYTFDPLHLTGGSDVFVAIKQNGKTPLYVAYDKVLTGLFWRYRNQELELVSTPTYGNIAVRLALQESTDSPTLSFEILDENGPVNNASIAIKNYDPVTTNENGKASIEITNGEHEFTISKDGFVTITENVVVNQANVNKKYTLSTAQTLTFSITHITDTDTIPIGGANITILNSIGTTNEDGKVSFDLAQCTHSYTITSNGHSPHSGSIELVSDSTLNIALDTVTTHRAAFKIVSKQLNSAINGATIELDGYGIKYTNEEGLAEFSGVLPTNEGVQYIITKDKYYSATGNTGAISNQDITVQDTLKAFTYYVEIEITDEVGPVEYAAVELADSTIETNNFGIAMFNEVVPATDIKITVSKEGYVTLTKTIALYNSNLRLKYTIEAEPSSDRILDQSPFIVYPNPTRDLLTIEGENTYRYEIIDITGRVITSGFGKTDKTVVSMCNYHKGLYIIRLRHNNKVYTHKFIKQ